VLTSNIKIPAILKNPLFFFSKNITVTEYTGNPTCYIEAVDQITKKKDKRKKERKKERKITRT
jgi:hypothetical protein